MWRCIFVIVAFSSCSAGKEDAPHHQYSFETTVFSSEYGGYGYAIHQGGKLIIHQPIVPAIAGSQGFSMKQQAQQVAALVVAKLEKGLMPPTVTTDEVNAVLEDVAAP